MTKHASVLLALLALTSAIPAVAKNRGPNDYPQRAKVISFQRQPCLHQVGGHTRVCHFITFEVDGQTLTGSCGRCDPLAPGQTYPARLDRKDLVLYVIHQKENGAWGQDNYVVTDMSASAADTNSH